MRPYKVLYLIDNLGAGGAQRQLMEWVTHLPPERVEPIVAVYRAGQNFYGDHPRYRHVRVVQLPKESKYDARMVPALARLARQEKVDAIHAMLLPAGAWALAAALVEPSLRVICSEQSDAAEGPPSWHIMRWATFPRADLVVANSMRAVKHLEERFRLPRGHVRYVPNAVEGAYWADPVPPSAHIEHLYGSLAPGPFRLAVLGSFSPWKDHTTFLRALARMEPHLRPATLMAGAPLDARTVKQVDALIAALDLSRHVARIEPLLDVRQLYQAADAVALTGLFEGFPNVAIEALASGRPILSTAVSDLPQWVSQGLQGWLFTPGQIGELVHQLHEMASLGPEGLASRADACQALASHFSPQATVQALLNCYASL